MGRVVVSPGGKPRHVGGRRPPPAGGHHLKLHAPRYGLDLAGWPTPPETRYSDDDAARPVLLDVLGNDQLGCCTAANTLHLQALRQAAAGRAVFHPALADVVALYSRDGGYVPGDPSTDQGCDEVTVLGNHVRLGIPSGPGDTDRAAGFLAVDASDRALVRAVVSMFVGATVCMCLPDAWLALPPGAPWAVPPGGFVADPANGHCFTLGDQNDHALTAWSWAERIELEYDALAAGCAPSAGGSLYVVVDAEVLSAASRAAPDGLDWERLAADFAELSGGAPPAAPDAAPAARLSPHEEIADPASGDPARSPVRA